MQAGGSGFRGAGESELVRLRELGEFLRRTRESLGLTMEEAVEATKVRGRYLTAIEQGDLRVLPGKVYARGFVRGYAEYLGLDGDEVTNLYLGYQRDEDKPLVPQSQAARRREDAAGRGVRRRRRVGRAIAETLSLPVRSRSGRFGLFTLAVVVFTALVLHYESSGSGPQSPNNIPVTQPARSASHGSVGSTGAPSAHPATHKQHASGGQTISLKRLSANSSGMSFQVTGAAAVHLKFTTATGRCWIQVVADNKTIFAQTVPQGQTITFSGQQSLQILLGAPSAVTMTVDGLPVPGTSTSPFNYTFLRKG